MAPARPAGSPAHQAASGSARLQLYFFSYVREAQRATAPGAVHASEIPFVFESFAARGNAAAAKPSPQSDLALSMGALMHSCWVAFAKADKPSCTGAPPWPQYSGAGDQLMEFAVDTGVRSHFHKSELDVIEARQMAPRPNTGLASR